MHIIATSTMVIADVHGRGHMGGWGGGRMWLWGTLMVLFWVAIIAGVVWLVSRGRTGTAGTTSSRPATSSTSGTHRVSSPPRSIRASRAAQLTH